MLFSQSLLIRPPESFSFQLARPTVIPLHCATSRLYINIYQLFRLCHNLVCRDFDHFSIAQGITLAYPEEGIKLEVTTAIQLFLDSHTTQLTGKEGSYCVAGVIYLAMLNLDCCSTMELWKGLSAIDMRGYLSITMLGVKANGNLQQQIGLLMAQILQE